MVIWIVGLSGAGKSTIGKHVYRQIRARAPNTFFLDGDQFRYVMGGDLGHTLEDRRANAGRMCRLGKVLEDQDINVVCCILSISEDHRRWNRENLKEYFEVYIKVSRETVESRDSKGLYEKAARGEIENVVGVDIEFVEPERPDMVVVNDDPAEAPELLAERIVDRVTAAFDPSTTGGE